MLKKIFLKLSINRALHKSGIKRGFKNMGKTKKIGIILDSSISNKKEINKTINALKADGKEVSTIFYESKKHIDPDFFPIPAVVFDENDMDMFGRFKREDIKKFISFPFDLIICLSVNSSLPIEFILANCNAFCRVGHFNESKKDYFELMFNSGTLSVSGELFNDMLFYLNKI